jgi:FSR family fosmidomycin resistance protein-like MFS transporter
MRQRIGSALVFIAIGHLVIEFSNNYMPIMYSQLIPIMGLSYAQVGLIVLVSSTVLSLTQPFFGYLSDRWDSVWLVSASIIWIGVMMGMVGFAQSYWVLLILVACGGLGSAAFHPAATIVAAANSGKRRGSGLSVFSVGGNIGSALSPLWMGLALTAFGTPATITILPIAVIYGVVFFVNMRREAQPLPARQSTTSEPATKGLLVGLVLLIVAMSFRSWYQVAFMTYLPTWIESTGGTLNQGSRTLATFLFAISVGSVIGGTSGDRYGYLKVLIVALAMLPFFHWTYLNAAGAIQLGAVVLSGVAVGCTFPTSIVLVLDAWPNQAGVAAGLLMGLSWWPGGLGTSLTGMVADRYSLTAGLTLLAFVPLCGALCLVIYSLYLRTRQSPTAQQVTASR